MSIQAPLAILAAGSMLPESESSSSGGGGGERGGKDESSAFYGNSSPPPLRSGTGGEARKRKVAEATDLAALQGDCLIGKKDWKLNGGTSRAKANIKRVT